MFLAAEIIDFAIQIERNAERLCRETARKRVAPDLASLLEWMADQEAQHIRWFSELRSKVRIACDDTRLENFGRTLLSEVLGDQGFSLKDADFSKLQMLQELLSLLIEFEQDTILFYEMLQAAVEGEETISLLDKIIAEENRHIVRIKEQLNKVSGGNVLSER